MWGVRGRVRVFGSHVRAILPRAPALFRVAVYPGCLSPLGRHFHLVGCGVCLAPAQTRFLPVSLEIHWLSVINSLVLVVLLMAFLAIILLRIVKSDFTR